jgi:adenine phosphoribosyltransferase
MRHRAVDELVQPWAGMKIDKVAGIEARASPSSVVMSRNMMPGFG